MNFELARGKIIYKYPLYMIGLCSILRSKHVHCSLLDIHWALQHILAETCPTSSSLNLWQQSVSRIDRSSQLCRELSDAHIQLVGDLLSNRLSDGTSN